MTVQNFTPQAGVNVTTAAAEHIRQQISKNPGVKGFRIGVRKSGCSGFMYVVDLVSEPATDDQRFTIGNGVDIYVDAQSLPSSMAPSWTL
jgi:iron-sulfur cluster assembly accessory protein